MKLIFAERAWDQYVEWRSNVKILRKINALLKDRQRHPETGLGQPEPLKREWTGWWSRRIDQEHRLVYRVVERDGETVVKITQCRGHY